MSQTDLAQRAGVERSHLSEVERGKIALPGADFRRRVASALGMSHAALLVAAGEMTEEEAGLAAMNYRPPFPDNDPRTATIEYLRLLSDEDAEIVRNQVRSFVQVRGRRILSNPPPPDTGMMAAG